jgi:HlyD family secretion protein
MEPSFLTLDNRFKRELKKGMTLNAQFILVERSLITLVYNDVDDWLGPSKNLNKNILT